tara:strand:+ start:525 stop:1601 length:1077 start_codon:yes stop_codon:yes gene_type:complete
MPRSKIIGPQGTLSRSLDDLGLAADIKDTGRRNLIINGGMRVAQRGSSTTTNGYGSLDRFIVSHNNMDNLAFTFAQDTDGPSGFSNSLKYTVTTAESALASDEIARVMHRIEGLNMQRTGWGTSSAKALTLSFYVKSSVTGTYAVEFRMNSGGSNSLSKNYTINSANTWERKTMTFPANTATAFVNTKLEACEIGWYLAAGTNYSGGTLASTYGSNPTNSRAAGQTANVLATNGNTWYLTGAQLEVSDSASDFEHRGIGEELRECQRYYQKSTGYALALANASTTGYTYRQERTQISSLKVIMRDSPAFTATTGISTLSGGVELIGSVDFVIVKPASYASDIPSTAYWYGGYEADAEL